MEDLTYKTICKKLGLDPKKEPIKILDGYDGPTIFDKLNLEEKEYLLKNNIEPDIILVDKI